MDNSGLPIINPGPRGECPFVRIQIGEDVFTSGDRRLLSASTVLGEGRLQSGCEFTIFDPDSYYANK